MGKKSKVRIKGQKYMELKLSVASFSASPKLFLCRFEKSKPKASHSTLEEAQQSLDYCRRAFAQQDCSLGFLFWFAISLIFFAASFWRPDCVIALPTIR